MSLLPTTLSIFNATSRLDIVFQEEKIREIEIELDGGKTVLATYTEAEEHIKELVPAFERGDYSRVKIFANDTPAVYSIIQQQYDDVIAAAGGTVINEVLELLVIHRNGKWDLPKGKVEKGEDLDVAAVREVEEETGLQQIELGDHLITTFHTYPIKEKTVLKETYWYRMKAPTQVLTPQAEEGIDKALWIPKQQFPEILADTYENIKLVIMAL